MGIQASGGRLSQRRQRARTLNATRLVAQWRKRRGFLQYRWKWPRDKFLQLLSNRRANAGRRNIVKVLFRGCGRLAFGIHALGIATSRNL